MPDEASTLPPEPTGDIRRVPRNDETLPQSPPSSTVPPSGGGSGRGGGAFGGRYTLLEMVGRGGMGQVYRAHDRALDRIVALKFLPEHLVHEWQRLLLREARAAARLQHPNLVTLFDVVEGDAPFLSMEFIQGISLQDLVKRDHPLPVWQTCDFIRQAAVGLQHVFENGLVHRDIKPSNLMVTDREQVVKILDLGIAQLTPPERAAPATGRAAPTAREEVGPRSALTDMEVADELTGSISGTPPYMSPEQWQGATADTRADIYSLGCTFYVLLTGHPPFAGTTHRDLFRQHVHDDPPPIEVLRPEVSPALGAIIRKMLAKDPADRYQKPIELIRALDRLAKPPAAPTPGAITTADQFADVLKGERLLSAKQLDALDTELLPKFPDLHPFVQELTRRGWLTAFQVGEILRGAGHDLALGGYVLTDLLGEGAFGRVYRSKQLLQGKEAAIKVIRPDLAKDAVAVARFRREIRAASRLAHPNVATVYTADEQDGKLFLVMELCPGENLDAVVATRHPVPWREACDWVKQAATGLHHIHEKGLVHRDVKPANLMLTPTGVKILDLGLAHVVSTDAGMSSSGSVGGAVGTPHYYSPEQANGDPDIDIRSDLYNLGGTMYHLLAGQPPYHGQNAARVFISQIMHPAKPITDHRADVPAEVAAVVHKLLAKAPADRYQTPAELIDALNLLPR